MNRKIRVLVVDDSIFFREAMRYHISRDPDMEIAGEAGDAVTAVRKIEELNPDVITLDIEMPGMNGIDFLKKVMPGYAIPVVVVSSANVRVFDALRAGALDFVAKPDSRQGMGQTSFFNELITKVKGFAAVNRSILKNMVNPYHEKLKKHTKYEMIAIGASTGGTEAIYKVVRDLPNDIPGIVIVQHMPPVFTRMYAERLNNSCALEAKEAENGDQIVPGRILVAPGDYQMRVRKAGGNYYVECRKAEKVNGHCPSVDVLFHSVAEKAGTDVIGILLTGMGRDGAEGLLEMRKKGARTFGQDEASSVVYGMPKEAYNMGAVEKQLPLNEIPQELMRILGY